MSNKYTHIKRLAFGQPAVLHALLDKLCDGITDYVRYQADNGAQVVQIFDSWASELSPRISTSSPRRTSSASLTASSGRTPICS